MFQAGVEMMVDSFLKMDGELKRIQKEWGELVILYVHK